MDLACICLSGGCLGGEGLPLMRRLPRLGSVVLVVDCFLGVECCLAAGGLLLWWCFAPAGRCVLTGEG